MSDLKGSSFYLMAGLNTSGAAKGKVPTLDISNYDCSWYLARPKSEILILMFEKTRIFAGLRSLCVIFLEWRSCSASTV